MSENYHHQHGASYPYLQYNEPEQTNYGAYSYEADWAPPPGIPNPPTPSHGYPQHGVPNSYHNPAPVASEFSQPYAPYPRASSYHLQQAYQDRVSSPNLVPFQHSPGYDPYYAPSASPYQSASPAAAPIQPAYPVAYSASPRNSYLTPTVSSPAAYAPPNSPQIQPQQQYPRSPSANYSTPAISITPQYISTPQHPLHHHYGSNTPVHTLHPVITTPAHASLTAPTPCVSPKSDHDRPTLNDSHGIKSKLEQHWATCDGCGAHPLEGNRWRCLVCTDYDLCGACREDTVHSHHRFECIHSQCETHQDACCDVCLGEDNDRLLCQCLVHPDDDWCERCKARGKACAGRSEVIRRTEVGMQLEKEKCLPMPNEWLPYLNPVVATYSVQGVGSVPMWCYRYPVYEWYDAPLRERTARRKPPKFRSVHEQAEGNFGHDGTCTYDFFSVAPDGTETKVYTYLERVDMKHNINTSETLYAVDGGSTSPKFTHDATSNTLAFQDPVTHAHYKWVSNRPISNLKGERYDYQRNALFHLHADSTRTLVADWTWHDGHPATESCLSIRSASVSHALVIMSLTILHSQHWDVIFDEINSDPERVNCTQAMASLTPLGARSFWHDKTCENRVNDGKGGRKEGYDGDVRLCEYGVEGWC